MAGPLACGTSGTTDTETPITGITVRAEDLTAGRGCGPAATQVFKFAVVVYGKNPSGLNTFDTPLASNVFDCFSDGLFVNVPASGGSTDYNLQIFAYNQTAYLAAASALQQGSLNPAALPATNPSYTTTCTATEVPDVQSLAVCQPLSVGGGAVGPPPPPATVTLPAGSFPRADSGVATCDIDYTTVRYRSSTGGVFSDISEARCSHVTGNGVEPITITVSPAVAPATYTIEVALLRADGSVLGQTTCGAETSPGRSSSAVCKPIP